MSMVGLILTTSEGTSTRGAVLLGLTLIEPMLLPLPKSALLPFPLPLPASLPFPASFPLPALFPLPFPFPAELPLPLSLLPVKCSVSKV